MKVSIRWITQTAVLLALCIVFQMLRLVLPAGNIASTLIVGSLVNLTLIIAALLVGFWSGASISVISVVIAFFQGHIPQIIPLAIAIALGNLVIVTVVWLLARERKFIMQAVGVGLGAVLKFLLLWGVITLYIVPNFVPGPKQALINLMFSYPQLITALIGGVLALIIAPRLRSIVKKV